MFRLLDQMNYHKAISKPDYDIKLQKRAQNLFKKYILDYPNSKYSYNFFVYLYQYKENRQIVTEIVNELKSQRQISNETKKISLLEILENHKSDFFKDLNNL
jgi:hypothetical protein